MISRQDFASIVERHTARGPLAPWRERIIRDWSFECFVLTSQAPSIGVVGEHRLGGLPDLPADLPYPHIGGEALSFLCQLNLSQLDDARLPSHGMLYFFIGNIEEPDNLEVRVMHSVAPITSLVPAAAPTAPLRSESDNYFSNPHSITVAPSVRLYDSYKPSVDGLENDACEAYDALCDHWEDSEYEHTLLGVGFSDYTDPRVVAADHHVGTKAEDWITLATFGFDKKVGFSFWDAGQISLMIERDALAAADFSRVHGYLYSS